MSDRDEMIKQGMLTLRDAMREGKLHSFSNSELKVLVDDGWRPPPSDDVIEKATQVLHREEVCTIWEDQSFCNGVCRSVADSLADAGLLSQPSDESWGALMRLLDKHWPEDVFPTNPPRPSARAPGPTIVSLLRWIDKLQAQSVPQDAAVERDRALEFPDRLTRALRELVPGGPQENEMVERVARSIYRVRVSRYRAYGITCTPWDELDERTADIFARSARAALRAMAGEADSDE